MRQSRSPARPRTSFAYLETLARHDERQAQIQEVHVETEVSRNQQRLKELLES